MMGRSILSCLKPRCLRPKTNTCDDEGQRILQEQENNDTPPVSTPAEQNAEKIESEGDKDSPKDAIDTKDGKDGEDNKELKNTIDTKDNIKHNKGFRPEDVEEYKAVFDFFDKKSKGHIKAKQVATVLRSLHPVPDEHLVAKEVAKISESYNNVCNFEQFLEVLNTTIRATRKSIREKKKKRMSHRISITEERRAEMKESFDMFDYDGDGTISLDELQRVMESCGVYVTEDEANDIISEFGHADTERGNNLNFDEFIDLMTSKENQTDANKELQEAFNFFDKDGSGSISADEVKAVMVALGENISDNDVFDMIKEADTKGDGEVSYQDFKKILTGGTGN